MSNDNKEQQVDQLLRGIYRMCVNRDDCKDCPFYITKCTFEEPKPRTWFDEETIEIQPEIKPEHTPEKKHEKEKEIIEEVEEPKEKETPEAPKENDDSEGTWLVSTAMGSVFSKYVFICSKCGYKKESVFSMTPMTRCPECEKRKAGLS